MRRLYGVVAAFVAASTLCGSDTVLAETRTVGDDALAPPPRTLAVPQLHPPPPSRPRGVTTIIDGRRPVHLSRDRAVTSPPRVPADLRSHSVQQRSDDPERLLASDDGHGMSGASVDPVPRRFDEGIAQAVESQNARLFEVLDALRSERDLLRDRYRAALAEHPETARRLQAERDVERLEAEVSRLRATVARLNEQGTAWRLQEREANRARRQNEYLLQSMRTLRNARDLWRDRYEEAQAMISESANTQNAERDAERIVREISRRNDYLSDALTALRNERDLWRDRYRAAQPDAP